MQQVDVRLKVPPTNRDTKWTDVTESLVGTAFKETFQLCQIMYAKDSKITVHMKIDTTMKLNNIKHKNIVYMQL
eukprot:15339002-Ditylum_brightwellii.AAC.1